MSKLAVALWAVDGQPSAQAPPTNQVGRGVELAQGTTSRQVGTSIGQVTHVVVVAVVLRGQVCINTMGFALTRSWACANLFKGEGWLIVWVPDALASEVEGVGQWVAFYGVMV